MVDALINNDTRILLKLTTHRAIAIYHRVLLTSPPTRDQYLLTLSSNSATAAVLSAIGELLLSAVQTPDVALAAATSLAAEFASIFWMEMAERLIRDSRCEFQNFGTFTRSQALGVVQVSFDSQLLVGEHTNYVELKYSDPFERSADAAYSSVSDQLRSRINAISIPFTLWRVPFMMVNYLASGITVAVRQFITDDNIRGAAKEFVATEGRVGKTWTELIAMLASSVSYKSWIEVFRAALAGGEEISVTGIGSLRLSEERTVVFRAEENFLRYIGANVPGRAAGIAA